METATKQKLIGEMEFYFGKDRRRIEHARNVVQYAEEILKNENDNRVNELVVIASAVLHDIGIHACEKKYNSTAGELQERESPPIARRIMEKLNLEEGIIEEVCNIISSHHSPGEVDTSNFKIVYDADWLVNLKQEVDVHDKNKLEEVINKVFLTETGKSLAEKKYLDSIVP